MGIEKLFMARARVIFPDEATRPHRGDPPAVADVGHPRTESSRPAPICLTGHGRGRREILTSAHREVVHG